MGRRCKDVFPAQGSRLKEARKRAALTQQDLAARLNFSWQTISAYENNRREIDRATAGRIAQACGVRVAWLMGADNYMTENDAYYAEYEKSLEDGDDFEAAMSALLRLHGFRIALGNQFVFSPGDAVAHIPEDNDIAYNVYSGEELLFQCTPAERMSVFQDVYDFLEFSIQKLGRKRRGDAGNVE